MEYIPHRIFKGLVFEYLTTTALIQWMAIWISPLVNAYNIVLNQKPFFIPAKPSFASVIAG